MKVLLTYFKQTGKYYSDGAYETGCEYLHQIWDEVKHMFSTGKRPGLVDGSQEFITLVRVPDHPHDHPRLIMPPSRSAEHLEEEERSQEDYR